MGELYFFDENPIQDYLMSLMLNDTDISELNIIEAINTFIINYLLDIGIEIETIKAYLDFKIAKDDDMFTIQANNIVCALWFTGFSPVNPDNTHENNYIYIDNMKYMYNPVTYKLHKFLIAN